MDSAARQLLVRADGSTAIGMGHLVRCLALAEELARHGMKAWFASRRSEGDGRMSVEYRGHGLVRVAGSPNSELAMIRAALPEYMARARRPFAAIVLDHYELGAAWLQEARRLGRNLVVIDDLADRTLPCDILVNATHGARAESYADLVPRKARLLIGSRYCLLRRAFGAAHERAGVRRHGRVKSILVTLGGGDHSETLRAVIGAARLAVPDAGIELVLGASEGGDLVTGSAMRVHRDLDDTAMASLMLSADLAIGAGGTTSWERCAVGLPSVSVRLAPNQDATVEALVAARATVDAGPKRHLTVAGLASQVTTLAEDLDQRRSMSENAWQLVDGRGAIRVAHAVDGVRVRRARLSDVHTLWAWANDPDTRAASFDSRPIPYAQHHDWLKTVLADPGRLLLIGWNGAGLLGQMRFDERGPDVEVSISVAPEHRGTVGTLLLAEGIGRYRRARPDVAILAKVKEENRASRRLFEAAGFARVSADRGVLRYRLGVGVLAGDVSRRVIG